MAIYIKLNKILQPNSDLHLYEVLTQDFKYPRPLFIEINVKNKTLSFILDQKNIYIVDLLEPKLSCPLLPEDLVFRIYKKVLNNIKNNDFPEYLDYAS
jgi:hypothetical protein